MKFGIREICDVVLKAKAAQKIGNKIFYANEPVLYFDTLKSSSMEGASTTVYAQGGRGNTRLVAWEGERTVTFTMEDALISPEGFMILTGAGLVESSSSTPIYQHMTETVDESKFVIVTAANKDDYDNSEVGDVIIPLDYAPCLPKDRDGDYAYVMLVKNGEIISEPYIPVHTDVTKVVDEDDTESYAEKPYVILRASHANYNDFVKGEKADYDFTDGKAAVGDTAAVEATAHKTDVGYSALYKDDSENKYTSMSDIIATCDSVIVDYYVRHVGAGDAKQIEISAESFGGNFYLEASTLFRDTNGSDLPAEFIIPNCKIQSNFNFTMASSGDPSTFTFTMDAFPDYTRWDRSKKVLAAIQILGADAKASLHRHATWHEAGHEKVEF